MDIVCVDEGFKEPVSEEARSARDEERLATQFLPQPLGVSQDVV